MKFKSALRACREVPCFFFKAHINKKGGVNPPFCCLPCKLSEPLDAVPERPETKIQH